MIYVMDRDRSDLFIYRGLAGPYASVTILGKAGPAMYTVIAFMVGTHEMLFLIAQADSISPGNYFGTVGSTGCGVDHFLL